MNNMNFIKVGRNNLKKIYTYSFLLLLFSYFTFLYDKVKLPVLFDCALGVFFQ